jgi:hypothetical protein
MSVHKLGNMPSYYELILTTNKTKTMAFGGIDPLETRW